MDLPCHNHLLKKGEPAWKSAEKKLKIVGEKVHAIDLHPFASFLTTLNVLFMVLPLYATARKQDPDFTVDLHVYSTDGLERPEQQTQAQMQMFSQMNSRIQLTADSNERYRKIINTKFDRVFGNPPWGGVLNGPLAPVYDTAKKKHFAKTFPHTAKGKYDVYGLFMERALQLLNVGGRFALLTQGTYLDKEWARGVRKLLSSETDLEYIIDLVQISNLAPRRCAPSLPSPLSPSGVRSLWVSFPLRLNSFFADSDIVSQPRLIASSVMPVPSSSTRI
jgi:hypothetical protein